MNLEKEISVIIPARNEAACLGRTLLAVLASAALVRKPSVGEPDFGWASGALPRGREAVGSLVSGNGGRGTTDLLLAPSRPLLGLPSCPEHLDETPVEVLVVDNRSLDGTSSVLNEYERAYGVRSICCHRLGAACARNAGARQAHGHLLVFVDADTRIPPAGLRRVSYLAHALNYEAAMFALRGDVDTWSSWCWWTFWNTVRRLPLAKAKALPAFMFCTREVFHRFGPFDESVQIGEEWPILAGLYRSRPHRLFYDRSLAAFTSNRRMTQQRFGYARVFCKYVWAILHCSGRKGYPDTFR